jgi:hypothetical protein
MECFNRSSKNKQNNLSDLISSFTNLVNSTIYIILFEYIYKIFL